MDPPRHVSMTLTTNVWVYESGRCVQVFQYNYMCMCHFDFFMLID